MSRPLRHVRSVPKNEPAHAGGAGGTVKRLRLPQQLFERAQVTGGRSVLRIEGFKHSNLKTGAPNEREAHQPAAPAHDRRHDGAQLRREDAQRLYPARQDIYSLSRPRAGYARGRGSSPFPAASEADRGACAEQETRKATDEPAPIVLITSRN